jgi:glycosyltransferase involved in cell wall biosynthesis
MTTRADIVIPTHNRAASLGRLLDALHRCEGIEHANVIVVDDGSEDETARVVTRSPIPVHYVRQDNAGPAVARNRGAALGAAPLVLFLDDDCVPTPTWLVDYLDAFDRMPEVDAFGGQIVARVDTSVTRFVQAEGLVHHGHGPAGAPVRFLVTANLGIRRAALPDPPFDERFPLAAAEDVDFSLRLLESDRRLALLDGGAVAHEHPRRWRDVLATYRRHGRGRVHLAAAHPRALTAVDAHQALSVAYWRGRYGRYREHGSPVTAVAYCAGRVAGLACMAMGARAERATLTTGRSTR